MGYEDEIDLDADARLDEYEPRRYREGCRGWGSYYGPCGDPTCSSCLDAAADQVQANDEVDDAE